MTASKTNINSSTKDAAGLPTPGTVLRLTREELSLSLESVAAELNVAVDKVQYLEADEFQKLHSEPFTRGYLRSYAKLLNIDANGLIECYEQFAGDKASGVDLQKGTPLSPGVANNKLGDKKKLSLFFPVILLLVGFVCYVLVGLDEPLPVMSTEDVSVAEPVAFVEGVDEESAVDITASIVAEHSEVAGGEIDQPSVEPERVSEGSGLDLLLFKFSDVSWIEVLDSRDDVLFVGFKQLDEQLSLQGVAPFRVTLGNAAAVELLLNGNTVDTEPEQGHKTLKLTVSTVQ